MQEHALRSHQRLLVTVYRSIGRGLLAATLLFFGFVATARASEGDTQTLVSIGSSAVYIDGATSTGTALGVRWGYEFKNDLLWTIGGSFGSTDGTQTVAGKDYTISTNTSAVKTGLLYYIGRQPNRLIVPFLGGGVGFLDYNVDYRYPGSKTGKTAGDGPGGFAFAGIELWLARAITVIVSYEAEGYSISRQGGGSTTLASGGVVLALRINLYSGS
jgi:hypothetical protein